MSVSVGRQLELTFGLTGKSFWERENDCVRSMSLSFSLFDTSGLLFQLENTSERERERKRGFFEKKKREKRTRKEEKGGGGGGWRCVRVPIRATATRAFQPAVLPTQLTIGLLALDRSARDSFSFTSLAVHSYQLSSFIQVSTWTFFSKYSRHSISFPNRFSRPKSYDSSFFPALNQCRHFCG